MNSSNSNSADLTAGQSRSLLSKITWRLVPLLFVCYIVAYIDRINIGFAKLQLQEILGVDEKIFGSVYGLGAAEAGFYPGVILYLTYWFPARLSGDDWIN